MPEGDASRPTRAATSTGSSRSTASRALDMAVETIIRIRPATCSSSTRTICGRHRARRRDQRLRFEHPEVKASSSRATKTASSARRQHLHAGSSTHSFKVNFCKFTNETRLYLEDASAQRASVAARVQRADRGRRLELALACDEICSSTTATRASASRRRRSSRVLPGTGGLTRLVDKRKVRRDLADVFSTPAEGIKGKRAKDWGLVDHSFPSRSGLGRSRRARRPSPRSSKLRAVPRSPCRRSTRRRTAGARDKTSNYRSTPRPAPAPRRQGAHRRRPRRGERLVVTAGVPRAGRGAAPTSASTIPTSA